MKTNLEKLEAATAIQCSDGNWNADPYMHGMANGMIFASACMKGEEPKYLQAPTEWLSSKPKDEAVIENEIQSKGLTAPRLTPLMIDAVIMDERYYVFPQTTLTVCCLVLRNGFCVTGESAAASPQNFDVEIGKKIARENARNKIWALEGYLLKQKLSEDRLVTDSIEF